MTCPTHMIELVPKATRYGVRYSCPAQGCTVVCWDGRTSTPADDQTRALRNECHKAFDPLWHDSMIFAERGKAKRKDRRRAAYLWLANAMSLDFDDTHFGMFDADQCRIALVAIIALRDRIKQTTKGAK